MVSLAVPQMAPTPMPFKTKVRGFVDAARLCEMQRDNAGVQQSPRRSVKAALCITENLAAGPTRVKNGP
jgi:hypothetical protein